MHHNPSLILEPGENLILLVREAKIVLLAKLLFWGFATAIPLIIDAIITSFAFDISPEWLNIWDLIKSLYLLMSLLGLLLIIVLYYLNVHVVTDRRLIDSDQVSIVRHQTTETHLDRVQDVAANINGVFAHIFNYGTVSIQSAGDIPKINFENVSDPKKIKRIILDAHYPFIDPPTP